MDQKFEEHLAYFIDRELKRRGLSDQDLDFFEDHHDFFDDYDFAEITEKVDKYISNIIKKNKDKQIEKMAEEI